MNDEPFSVQFEHVAALVERGDYAAEDTRELVRDVRRSAETTRERAQVTLLEATLLERVGRDAEALIALDTAQGLCGDDDLLFADVLALRASVQARRGQLLAASESARSALEKNPAHVKARLALARVYFDVQEPRRAISLYHEALPLLGDPVERAKIHLTIADAYRRLRLPVLARTHARAALALHGKDETSLPLSLALEAVWLRVSSLSRPTRWLTVLAVASLLLSGALGSMSWLVAVGAIAAVLLADATVAWFTTPAVKRVHESETNRRRFELEEREKPA